MDCIAIRDDYLIASKGLHIDCYHNSKHAFLVVPSTSGSQENDHITDICISTDGIYLAIITSVSKRLLICSLPLIEIVKTYELPRSASKIRFTTDNSKILVADKSGDILLYELISECSGTKLLGHLSLLLDVLQTNDSQYIITSDRDEKIRVSQFPNTYNIQTFCLGHKEFVNHIEILPHAEKYLTSSSGDGTVKLWNYINGTCLYTINTGCDIDDPNLSVNFTKIMDEEGVEITTLPIVHYTIDKLTENSSVLSVSIHSYNKLLIYTLESNGSKFSHKKEDKIKLERFPAAVKFNKLSLFIYDDVESSVTTMQIIYNSNKISYEFNKRIQMFESEIDNVKLSFDIEAIKVLYKRRYDNVQEYQERKRQRLERNNK